MKRKRYHIIIMVILTILFGRISMMMEVCALDRVKSGEDKEISVSVESGGDVESSETMESEEDKEGSGTQEGDGRDESHGADDETSEEENEKSQEETEDDVDSDEATPSEAEYAEAATPSSAKIMLLKPLLENGGCSTIEELKHQTESGEYEKIMVAGDIIVDDEVTIETEENVVIDMNGNRLLIQPGGVLNIRGPVQLVGTVTKEALVEVDGSLSLRDGAEINAEGEDVVAVWCKEDVGLHNAAIRSFGSGSRALVWESDRLCTLKDSTIEAQGSGSIGIVSDSNVELKLCRVLSQGGKSVVSTEGVCLDATLATPLPEGTVVIKRKIYPARREEENGISIVAGSSREEFLDKVPHFTSFLFYDDSGTAENWSSDFLVTWSNLPDDLSNEGEYIAVCRPLLPNNSNRLPLPELNVPVYVVDPLKPHIQEIFRMGYTATFRYLNPVIGAEKLQLLYSVDEGRNWKDAAVEFGESLSLSEYRAALDGLEINKKYLFKLVVSGGPMEGESLAVPFYYYENDADRYEHGDRDGDDRDEEDETLPDSIPPIFSAEEDSEADGGGEYNSSAKPAESNQNNVAAEPTDPEPTDPEQTDPEQTDPEQTNGTAGAKEQNLARQVFAADEPDQNTNSDILVLEQDASDRQPPLEIVLSGSQLSDQLQANNQWITFAGEGIKVDLPADGLRDLSMAEDDTFTASLQRTVSDRFAIRFWSGETELTEFGDDGFFVELPWKDGTGEEEGIPVVCEREDGLRVGAHLSDRKIRGRFFKTGEYQIRLEREEQRNQKIGTSSPVRAAGMVLAGTAMVLFLIQYRNKAREGRV